MVQELVVLTWCDLPSHEPKTAPVDSPPLVIGVRGDLREIDLCDGCMLAMTVVQLSQAVAEYGRPFGPKQEPMRSIPATPVSTGVVQKKSGPKPGPGHNGTSACIFPQCEFVIYAHRGSLMHHVRGVHDLDTEKYEKLIPPYCPKCGYADSSTTRGVRIHFSLEHAGTMEAWIANLPNPQNNPWYQEFLGRIPR